MASRLGQRGETLGHHGNVLLNSVDPFGILGDEYDSGSGRPHGYIERTPLLSRHPDEAEIDAQLGRYLSAAALAERQGKPVSPFVRRRIERLQGMGGQATPLDFNAEDFDLAQAQSLRKIHNQQTHSAINPALWNARLQEIQTENAKRADQRFFDEQIDPQLSTAQDTLFGLTTTPTFGAGQIGDMRSQLAAGIKGSEEEALHRTASIFGLSGGLGAGSPAAAALAERVAAEHDAQLAESLQRLDFDTTQTNRSNQERSAGLLSQLSIARQAARQAATAGDRQRLYQIQDNIAAIQAAIRAQSELRDYQQNAADEAASAGNKANYFKLGGAVLGSFFGPIGTAIGSGLGAAAGQYAANRNGDNALGDPGYTSGESGFGSPTSGPGHTSFDYGGLYNPSRGDRPTFDKGTY